MACFLSKQKNPPIQQADEKVGLRLVAAGVSRQNLNVCNQERRLKAATTDFSSAC